MIRAKDGNGCCTSWCCCIRQQIAELWQRIEGTVRGVKMNGNIIEPDGDGIVDLDVNFPVDGAMDPTSVNPVQNRVVTDAILTERSERIDDDRRHDLEIQGLENEMQTKLTTPSGGVQGQVLGKGAQGIGWVDTITEARAQEMEDDIASVDGRLTREIADRTAADDALQNSINGKLDKAPSGTIAQRIIETDGSGGYRWVKRTETGVYPKGSNPLPDVTKWNVGDHVLASGFEITGTVGTDAVVLRGEFSNLVLVVKMIGVWPDRDICRLQNGYTRIGMTGGTSDKGYLIRMVYNKYKTGAIGLQLVYQLEDGTSKNVTVSDATITLIDGVIVRYNI